MPDHGEQPREGHMQEARTPTHDEAIATAIEALGYVLDNDFEYLAPETLAAYQDAWDRLHR